MLARNIVGVYDPTSTSPALTTGGDECWGQALTGCAAGCTPGFQPGRSHFKSKFCKACQMSLRVPAERVRVLTDTELAGGYNRRSEGFWSVEATGILRVVNNTATCVRPALAIYRDELPAEARAGWSPLPAHWVDRDGYVRFCVSKGTLVPAASLRGGQLYLGPHQKRQQRLGPQAVFAPHATFAPSSAERQSDDGARDSGPFAASPVDSPSNESVYYLDVMAVPVQLPAMRVSDLRPPLCTRKHGEEPPAEASALLEHISPNEMTGALGLVTSPPCAPPAQRAAAPPCAPPPPDRGAAHWFSPLAYVPSAQGAAPPPKAAVCATALTAAAKDVAPFPAPFPPPSAAQQAPRPETLLPEELAPALNSALEAVGALLGATLDQAQLSAPQRRFLRAQRRQFEESSYALHHLWRRPSQLEEHAMPVEAQLGLHWADGARGGAHGRAGESPLVRRVLGEQGRSHTHSGVAAQRPSLSMNPTRPRSATDSCLADHRTRMSGLRAALKSMFREPRGGSIP